MFVQTLTADDKYSLRNRDNLMQPNHILISEKQKIISLFLYFYFYFFCVFFKSKLNFEHFFKKRWL